MSMTIIKPGLLATVQDLGRKKYGKYGVIVSGAMDTFAHRIANWLVGNDEGAALLEITWFGLSVRMDQDMWIAITGGDFSPVIDGIPVPQWRPVFVRKGTILAFTKPQSGCRTYLAAAGGIDVPEALGSRSTYIRAGIGGLNGRPLRSGDVLHIRNECSRLLPPKRGGDGPFYAVGWSVPSSVRPVYGQQTIVRIMRGLQFDDFDEESRRSLLQHTFQVTPQSDRMGYRLSGPRLKLSSPRDLISEGVAMGTIQVPADGQPIILMADRQTLGGYPKIAQTASIDIPLIAQIPPGGIIRFREIELREAESLYLEWGRKVQRLALVIRLRLKEDGYLNGPN